MKAQKKLRNDSHYRFLEKPVGEGAYGVVYKATDMRSGTTVALKMIRSDEENDGIPATALREIAVLKELDHPCLVKLLDVDMDHNKKLYLIFDWMDQDLRRHMDNTKASGVDGFSPLQIQSYMYQLLHGLDYCHSRTVIHRDLKPQNLLIDNRGRLKLADFGLARAFCIPFRCFTHEVVTLWYRAPELLLGMRKYALPVDVWSVACIFAEMCSLSPLYPGESEIDQMIKIFQSLGTPSDSVWPKVSELPDYQPLFPKFKAPHDFSRVMSDDLEKITTPGLALLQEMFKYDPATRITAREALKHPYFDSIRLGRHPDEAIKAIISLSNSYPPKAYKMYEIGSENVFVSSSSSNEKGGRGRSKKTRHAVHDNV